MTPKDLGLDIFYHRLYDKTIFKNKSWNNTCCLTEPEKPKQAAKYMLCACAYLLFWEQKEVGRK